MIFICMIVLFFGKIGAEFATVEDEPTDAHEERDTTDCVKIFLVGGHDIRY